MNYFVAALSMVIIMQAQPKILKEDYPRDPEHWYAIDPPDRGSDQWLIAQSDVDHEWIVIREKTGLRIDLRQGDPSTPLPFEIKPDSAKAHLAGKRTAKKVSDGWIIGFDDGEFGAGLWWFSPNGKSQYKISEDHVIGFVSSKSGLLAVEGLVHGGETKGKIIGLSLDELGRWSTYTVLELEQAPHAFGIDEDGSLIIATSDRLLRIVSESKMIEVVFDHAFWVGLYPNSITVGPSGSIFVGMRHGVAKIDRDKNAYKIRWLLPSKKIAEQKYEVAPR